MNQFERDRLVLNVMHDKIPHFMGADNLVQYLKQHQGSRVVVLNTVKSAAYLAQKMREDGHDVLHLSTALTPWDREEVIKEVQKRLQPESNYNSDWTLVATSCIECGMNFSFQYGFCELRSLASYLQLGGRVSRNGEYLDSSLNVFTITDSQFNQHKAFQHSQTVFHKIIESRVLSNTDVTKAVTQAFDLECKEMGGLSDEFCKLERSLSFEDVAKNFVVIEDDTVTVVADQKLAQKMNKGEKVSITELQKGSVRLHSSIAKKLGCENKELPILKADQYDNFLGYMKTLI